MSQRFKRSSIDANIQSNVTVQSKTMDVRQRRIVHIRKKTSSCWWQGQEAEARDPFMINEARQPGFGRGMNKGKVRLTHYWLDKWSIRRWPYGHECREDRHSP